VVRKICGVGVYLRFAKDVWGCRRLKIRGWSSTLFVREDEFVVLVAERLEGGPVSSRVSTFPDVFSMAGGGPKCTEGGRKPWV